MIEKGCLHYDFLAAWPVDSKKGSETRPVHSGEYTEIETDSGILGRVQFIYE
jgi:hypothetical protein